MITGVGLKYLNTRVGTSLVPLAWQTIRILRTPTASPLLFFLLPGVEAGPFPLAAEEAKRLPLPPAAAAREANSLAWAVTARDAEPRLLPSEEATATAWRPARRGGVDLVLLDLDLGVALPALGVETGAEPPRRSGGRLARFGRSATGDPFRDLGGALAEAFVVLVRRLGGTWEGASRGTTCGGWGAEG